MNDQEIDRWLDAALSAPAPSAPAGFTDRVMARVASAPRVSPVQTEALPWWRYRTPHARPANRSVTASA